MHGPGGGKTHQVLRGPCQRLLPASSPSHTWPPLKGKRSNMRLRARPRACIDSLTRKSIWDTHEEAEGESASVSSCASNTFAPPSAHTATGARALRSRQLSPTTERGSARRPRRSRVRPWRDALGSPGSGPHKAHPCGTRWRHCGLTCTSHPCSHLCAQRAGRLHCHRPPAPEYV